MLEIKSYIAFLATKYHLQPTKLTLSQVVQSQKTKMWGILCETQSTKLKNRGEFPVEIQTKFDRDIEILASLGSAEKLKYLAITN